MRTTDLSILRRHCRHEARLDLKYSTRVVDILTAGQGSGSQKSVTGAQARGGGEGARKRWGEKRVGGVGLETSLHVL